MKEKCRKVSEREKEINIVGVMVMGSLHFGLNSIMFQRQDSREMREEERDSFCSAQCGQPKPSNPQQQWLLFLFPAMTQTHHFDQNKNPQSYFKILLFRKSSFSSSKKTKSSSLSKKKKQIFFFT